MTALAIICFALALVCMGAATTPIPIASRDDRHCIACAVLTILFIAGGILAIIWR